MARYDRISGVVCTRCFDLDNLAFVSVTLKRPTPNAAAILAEGRRPGSYSAFIESAVISRNTLLVSIADVDAAGEPTANLLTLYLSQGRLTGTDIGNTRPDRRNNVVWVRQHDPDAPKDAVWRGAFDGQP